MSRAASDEGPYPRRKIFLLSSLSLFTAGLSFALRGAIIASVVAELAPGSAELAGRLLGTAFLGFGLTLFFASIVLERIGMGRTLLARMPKRGLEATRRRVSPGR